MQGWHPGKGFTLTEMMIAVAIISILLVMSVPAFTDYLSSTRLKAASETLLQRLEQAHSLAIENHEPVFVHFQTGPAWCYAINPGSACSCTQATRCKLGTEKANSNSHIELEALGLSNNNTLRFDGLRGLTSSNSWIEFKLDQKSIIVKVSKSGQLSKCSDSNLGLPAC